MIRKHPVQVVLDNSDGTIRNVTAENVLRYIGFLEQNIGIPARTNRTFYPSGYALIRNSTPEDQWGTGMTGTGPYPTGDCPLYLLLKYGDRVGSGNSLSNPKGELVAKLRVPGLPTGDADPNWVPFRNMMTHEVMHPFDCSGGDWVYKGYSVKPASTLGLLLPPYASIYGGDPNDSYWSDPVRQSWQRDFMTGSMQRTDLRLSEMHRLVLLGEYRSPRPLVPLDNSMTLIVVDKETRNPVVAHIVQVHCDRSGSDWKVIANSMASHVRLQWAENSNIQMSQSVRLIRCYAPGYRPATKWIMVGDCYEMTLRGFGQVFIIEMERDGSLIRGLTESNETLTSVASAYLSGGRPGVYYALNAFRRNVDTFPQPIAVGKADSRGNYDFGGRSSFSKEIGIYFSHTPLYGVTDDDELSLVDEQLQPSAPPPPPPTNLSTESFCERCREGNGAT